MSQESDRLKQEYWPARWEVPEGLGLELSNNGSVTARLGGMAVLRLTERGWTFSRFEVYQPLPDVYLGLAYTPYKLGLILHLAKLALLLGEWGVPVEEEGGLPHQLEEFYRHMADRFTPPPPPQDLQRPLAEVLEEAYWPREWTVPDHQRLELSIHETGLIQAHLRWREAATPSLCLWLYSDGWSLHSFAASNSAPRTAERLVDLIETVRRWGVGGLGRTKNFFFEEETEEEA